MSKSQRKSVPADATSKSLHEIRQKCRQASGGSTPIADSGATTASSRQAATDRDQAIFAKFLGTAAASEAPDYDDDPQADAARQSGVNIVKRSLKAEQGADPVAPSSITELHDVSGEEFAEQG